jgi:hypothetical protein
LEGGTHPAESAHYRFRKQRVYPPRRAAEMKKGSTNERVKLANMEPAALSHTSKPSRICHVCSAVFFVKPATGQHASTVSGSGGQMDSSCRRFEHNVSSISPST